MKGSRYSPITISGKVHKDDFSEIPEIRFLLRFDRRSLFWHIVINAARQIHEFGLSPDYSRKGSVVGKELSFLSAFSRVFSRPFLRTHSPWSTTPHLLKLGNTIV